MTNIARATIALLVLAVSAACANEPVRIEAGGHREGPVETRNGAVFVGNEATVDGDVKSRNGAISLGSGVTAGRLDTRNGAITAKEGGRFGDVSTRNGSIDLGANSRAGVVSSRNGRIDVGPDSEVHGLEARNGSIEGGTSVRVREGATSRNGSVFFDRGSRIGGNVSTRNGGIHLRGVEAGSSLQSRAGDIRLDGGTEVAGDVRIEVGPDDANVSGFLWFFSTKSFPDAGDIHVLEGSTVRGDLVVRLPDDYDAEPPTVTVDADSRVEGTVRVDARAELAIAEGAAVGGIERTRP